MSLAGFCRKTGRVRLKTAVTAQEIGRIAPQSPAHGVFRYRTPSETRRNTCASLGSVFFPSLTHGVKPFPLERRQWSRREMQV